jgi:hypothetical protein
VTSNLGLATRATNVANLQVNRKNEPKNKGKDASFFPVLLGGFYSPSGKKRLCIIGVAHVFLKLLFDILLSTGQLI